MKVEDEDLVIA